MSEEDKPITAVALHYDNASDGSSVPTVTAKGCGEIAEQIISLAKQHGIPLQENAPLTALLAKLDLGTEIPAELYLAVAEVIAFAYLLSEKRPATE